MSDEQGGTARVTEEQLLADLDSARQDFMQSLVAFDEIICDIPSSLPAPDGVYRIRNSAKTRDTAYARYKTALKRLTDHFADNQNVNDSEGR